MIILHRKPEDPFAAEIEEVLKNLVVAYQIQEHSDKEPADIPPEHDLPFIRENKTTITGKEHIKKYLEELADELRQQRSITGDACYIDPETGEIC